MDELENVISSFYTRVDNVKKKLFPKKDEYHDKMIDLGAECQSILLDGRYEGQQQFLSEAIKVLRQSLQQVLTDVKSLDKENILLKACTIAAQIEAYEKIMTRPDKVLKEIEEYKKNIKGDAQ